MHARTLLSHYGYLGILIALSLEYLFIPFPAETILILAGAMWHQGILAFWPLVLIATIGAFIGSWLGYFIGAWLGRPMLLRFGNYVRLTEKKMHQVEQQFSRFAIFLLLFGRWIAGVRVIVTYIAGINAMNRSLYLLITLISSALFSTLFVVAGASIDASYRVIAHYLFTHRLISGILILALLAIFVFWYYRKKKQQS